MLSRRPDCRSLLLVATAWLVACGSGSGTRSDVPDATDVTAAETATDEGPGEIGACVCGNAVCESACDESLATCPCDCRVAGDGTCSACEGPVVARDDCCGTCGDGMCIGYECLESPEACPQDCGADCGNGACDKGETPYGCPDDCKWQYCGNGTCEPTDGGVAACPEDCGPDCGDCECGSGESWITCPIDCGYCGDKVCSECARLLEGAEACPKDCAPESCEPGAYTACCGAAVCSFDSCDRAEAQTATCDQGCVAGHCVAAPALTLAFAAAKDDVGKTLAGASLAVFNRVVAPGGTAPLEVVVQDGGVPVAGLQIDFTQRSGIPGLFGLDASEAMTDADGRATVTASPLLEQVGTAQWEACVDGKPEVPCVLFNLYLSATGHVPLAVAMPAYTGTHPTSQLRSIEVRVYRQGDGVPLCADLMAGPDSWLPDAAYDLVQLTDTAFFETVSGMSEGVADPLTVFVQADFSPGDTKLVQTARGCVDTGLSLDIAQGPLYVEAALADLVRTLAATYVLVSAVDLYSTLPEPVRTLIDGRLAFHLDPTLEAMKLYCTTTDPSGDLMPLCKALFTNPAAPALEGLTSAGIGVRSILDQNFQRLLAQGCPFPEEPAKCETIYYTLDDLRKPLQGTVLGARLVATGMPGADGQYPAGAVRLSWQDVAWRWPFATGCAADDPGCATWGRDLAGIAGWQGQVEADVQTYLTPDGRIQFAPMTWSPGFGAIVLDLLDEFLAGRIYGESVSGYMYVLKHLHGGPDCQDGTTCCQAFGDAAIQMSTGLDSAVVNAACLALVETSWDALSPAFLALDTPESLTFGAPDGCELWDDDGNGTWDRISDASAPCDWTATWSLSAGDAALSWKSWANVD